MITGGDIYGIINENTLIQHRMMLPPGKQGRVSYIAEAGNYTVEDEIIEIEFEGEKQRFNMIQVSGAMIWI